MRDLGRFVIRAASEAGASEVLEFYADNAHENNAQRGDDVMLQAIRDRKLFVVEDPSGRIVGAAAVFGHEVGGKLFLEAGASRVPRLGGFKPLSFHQILHRVRSVHAHV